MKTRLVLLLVLCMAFSNCKTPSYLPNARDVDTNTRGGHISLSTFKSGYFNGELIAVSDSNVVIYLHAKEDGTREMAYVKRDDVRGYSLRFAKSKNYYWAIPVYTVWSITHGIFALITAPLNLITTIALAVGSDMSFRYNKQQLPLNRLNYFARFPQGLPEGIDLADLR